MLLLGRDVSLAHLAAHAALGTLFVVAADVVIRLPLLASGGAGTLLRSTAAGLAEYYPLAMAVYGLLVALGHLTPRAAAAHAPTS